MSVIKKDQVFFLTCPSFNYCINSLGGDMKNLVLLISICLLFTINANSEECSEVRMDIDGSMTEIDVREQYLGTCYAYASATAYDALRFSLGESSDTYTHPLFATLLYKSNSFSVPDKEKAFLEGGRNNILMDLFKRQGSCLMPKEEDRLNLAIFENVDFSTHREYLNSLLSIFEDQSIFMESAVRKKNDFMMVDVKRESTRIDPRYLGLTGENAQLKEQENAPLNIPSLKAEYINQVRNQFLAAVAAFEHDFTDYSRLNGIKNDIAEKLARNVHDRMEFDFETNMTVPKIPAFIMLENLFDGCKRSANYASSSIATYDFYNDPDYSFTDSLIEKRMNYFLTKKTRIGLQPIVLSMCAKALENKNYDGINRSTEKIAEDCGAHALLVIGSRKNPRTNKCEYLVRNSWGKVKSSLYPTDEKKQSQWIPKDIIVKNTFNINVYHD